MTHDIRHADPRTVAAGALSMLVSDALNGITPNDSRLLSYLAAVGVTAAAAQAAVSRLRGAVRAEASVLLGRKPQSQAMALMVSQASDEWYTPAWVLDLARQILGGIELDPASSAVANTTVQAARFYTQKDDGYSHSWACETLWLNPPFTDAERWSKRLAAAYQDGEIRRGAILLVNSAPGYHWYKRLVDAWPAVQLRERLVFCGADGKPYLDANGRPSKAKKSQTLVYFGADVGCFYAALAPYGRPLAQAAGAVLVAPLFEEMRDAA